jgi:GNAT superfamily N-acetyltransferase
MEVRPAASAETTRVLSILDMAMLSTDEAAVREAVDRDDVLVATSEDRILGAIVLAGDHVDAIAVRPNRRGQGIGTVLVEAAARRRDRLVAEFDAGVRPFWESLGFAVAPLEGEERYRGVRAPD